MRHARAVARLLGMLVVTSVLLPFLVVSRWRNRVVRMWARAVARCLALRVTVEGSPPRGGFVLVSNHISYLDLLLFVQFVDVVFVAMSQLRPVPIIGAIVAAAGTIFIDRSSKRDAMRVVGEIESVVRRGGGSSSSPRPPAATAMTYYRSSPRFWKPRFASGSPSSTR